MTILLNKIKDRSAKVGILGLGYVGMPLVRAFYSAGFHTLGFDIDNRKVDALLKGENYIKHMDSTWLAPSLQDGKFEPTSDFSRLGEADCVLICVPTPLSSSRDPDLSYIVSSGEAIAKSLRPDQLIVLESTTYPGTTRDVLLPILEKAGLNAGKDLFVAYSPEREDPGNATYTASSIPKVVGGYDATSLELAEELYSAAVVSTVGVSTLEIAEACKILENTYRSVNIAMINELKVLFTKLGIDIWEVVDAAKTKPFGFQAFYPGPGLGGHCIPIDPFYLSWLARCNETPTRFIELAGEINTSMPEFVISRLMEALNQQKKSVNGSKVGILGVAYKKDVDDPRESPSFRLMELLAERGAEISYSDPHIPSLPAMRSYEVPALESQELTDDYLASLDCALIATDHSAFDYDSIVTNAKLVIDTRNATANVMTGREKIWKA